MPLEQRNFKNCWFVYWSRGLFLWMVQRRSRFWNLKRGDGTTQEFVSGAFRVCKFQSGLLAKYFILANNCSWSHTNVGQTGGDLSFRVPYLFQIHWPHGVFHQKCDHETSSFCVAFGSLGFFLTSTFPALKHHQACTRLQSAWQLQLSIGAFGKTKLQKLLDPKTLYESILSSFFFESTPFR